MNRQDRPAHLRGKGSISILLVMLLLLAGCGHSNGDQFEAEEYAMGTVISQTVYGPNARKAGGEVFVRIKNLEEIMSFNVPRGDIYRINQSAGVKAVEIDGDTVKVLKTALLFAELSNGAFDPTIGPVVNCWSIGGVEERVPEAWELEKLAPLVNYRDVYLDDHSAGLKNTGQMFDLGGIAKGYAGDAAAKIYRQNGCGSAIINLGGNVMALGNKPDGSQWRIGIQDPRAGNGKIIGTVRVTDNAVVTSGDYQKYFIRDGKRYHHIINPRTGCPAESDLISVTVIAGSSAAADALSTGAFVLGLEKGRELIGRYGEAEAVFITADKMIYVTEGLQGNFQFLNGSDEYSYAEKG